MDSAGEQNKKEGAIDTNQAWKEVCQRKM